MPRRGRKRKKTRTHATDQENAAGSLKTSEETKIPKSLVIRRGKCEMIVADLVHDIRKVMMPYTAANFKEDANYRKLTLQKYCQHACLPLGVSHMLVFSQKEERLSLRIAKTPQGPTLTFRVHQFSLAKHVQKLQRRPFNINSLIANSPIVVTNNFGDVSAPPQVKLMRITFQNMFPAINVATVRLKECRRVVLFHLIDCEENNDGNADGEKQQRIEVRHYAIKATPVGVDKKVRRLIQTKIPNLNKVQDIADYITGTANASSNVDIASDSEPEEGNAAVVELAQNYAGRGNRGQSKSALKLVELGPRLSLQLVKVEQGLGDGNVMYHAHIRKSVEEAKAIQRKVEERVTLKQQRREEQARNVEKKQKEKDEKRQAKRQRKEEREKSALEELRHKEADQDGDGNDNDDDDDDDDDDLENEDLGVSDIEDDDDDDDEADDDDNDDESSKE